MSLKKLLNLFIVSIIIGTSSFGVARALDIQKLDVDDFIIDDFTTDYYLEKTGIGASKMRVVEQITAIFPDYEQNKGICRSIPYTYQDKVLMDEPTTSSLNLKRNGESEPVYSIEKGDGIYSICTGTDDYLTGKQIYSFEYEYYKVVADFGGHQELYWDTNGTGWKQKFNSVTARVHFDDDSVNNLYGEPSCYVGKYGEKGQDRCTINKTDSMYEFSAKNLEANENLTFDVMFKSDSFRMYDNVEDYAELFITTFIRYVAFLKFLIL